MSYEDYTLFCTQLSPEHTMFRAFLLTFGIDPNAPIKTENHFQKTELNRSRHVNQTPNPFDQILNRLDQLEKALLEKMQDTPKHNDPHGVDLDKYIPLSVVTEKLNIDRDTLYRHKIHIDYVKRFNQIYFLKDSLDEYMKSGKCNPVIKPIKNTRRKN